MRNSVEPIPWTQRDSRPKSQAELDKEELFNVYRRMKIPRPIASDLHRRLEHYQQMITRILSDAAFREEVELAAETCPGVDRQRSKKKRKKRKPVPVQPVQPELFRHFERIFSEPEPKAPKARKERTLEELYREYHIDTPELRAAWLPALTRLLPKSTL